MEQHLNTAQQWSRTESSLKDNGIKGCEYCKVKYQWPKSTATLKMTYCSVSCEVAGVGFHIDSFIKKDGYIITKSEPRRIKSDLVVIEDPSVEEVENIIEKLTQEDDDDDRDLVPV